METARPILSGTILLIDDDPVFRGDMKNYLEQNALEVTAIESGNHAIRYIQNKEWSWHPSLIITDLVMDGMGGYQLIRRIGELYPNRGIPIVVVSKLSSAEDINEAELAGASAYIRKPFKKEILIKTIGRITEKNKGKRHTLIIE